jgi:hypothetical protein
MRDVGRVDRDYCDADPVEICTQNCIDGRRILGGVYIEKYIFIL